ncbi:Pimeloyl-[acyl-carrier protein] methyl ester esterase [Vibrio aerogenes CECT 7868]|uniref:Pimeloyl-[acyl-carrier protein] methyl ester esterase n=1 Tax=Vibrio aerogenes CECT 7868 TaxID=1216006 RepID=A0A1M5YVE2_9VIBR|nr:pimeloyl-ACP methyl ester esterase BioH [Vibrio aerogenes]SHI15800.1 Pimeloyl-[acyl-carrier protein] methyl ester esterase [Vibrio aerogenes CECT 7868]
MSEVLHWQTEGEGPDLVLIHGWGMNGAVWDQTVEILKHEYRVHVVDLPGYGHSGHCCASSIEETALLVLQGAPEQAVWLGWSLGGLIATHIALNHPARVKKLITVASSPKFAAQDEWRGIQPKVLKAFTSQLVDDFQLTIERFMALQAMGSPTARQDVKALKEKVLSRPAPRPEALFSGLKMLSDIDMRTQLSDISVPLLRLYGRLDGLVPVQVANDLNTLVPESQSCIFSRSSHAPFITETDDFCHQVLEFAAS